MENSDTEYYNQLLELCDAKLLSEDGYSYNVHRFQLVKNSDYFRTLFCGVLSKNQREFTIPGISGECLGNILCYLYRKYVFVTEHNIADLLVAADYLLLPDLHQNIKGKFLRFLTEASCLRLFAAAEMINNQCISKLSFRFVQTHFENIMQTIGNGLTNLPIDVLHKILSNKSICTRSEFTVWHAIVEWLNENLADRIKYTPHLLSLLARKEMDEELATEVLQYYIINRNRFVCSLDDMITSFEFSSNLEILQNFLENFGGMDYRIPPRLHVVTLRSTEDDEPSTLYVTYDENMDLWREIGEVDFYPECAIPVGHNIFVFGNEECVKFDLYSQQYFYLRNFRNSIRNFSVLDVGNKLYVLGEINFNNCYRLQMYHPDTDLWSVSNPCPTKISNAIAVAVSKKIYIVGYIPNSHEMVAHAFDTETWQWSHLPSPDTNRTMFSMVAFRECLYLVGGLDERNHDITKVEIFHTNTNIWIEMADIPHVYGDVRVVIWEDQIVVFDRADDWYISESTVCWNAQKNSWETFDKTPQIDLSLHLFYTIRNTDSILIITRRNRHIDNEFYRLFD